MRRHRTRRGPRWRAAWLCGAYRQVDQIRCGIGPGGIVTGQGHENFVGYGPGIWRAGGPR